jgi:hypothetical protein
VDDLTVEVAVVCDGHVGTATTNVIDDDALAACAGAAGRAAEAAARSGGSGGYPGLPGPASPRGHEGHDPATARLDPILGGAALATVFAVAAELGWVRPVLDFAHLHAVTNGAFTEREAFAGVLEIADSLLEPGAPFHVHFSDTAFANRNEVRHLPYGEGTLRAEPLRAALEAFERPATVISESPDEGSHQAIRSVLVGSPVSQPETTRRYLTRRTSSPPG